MNANEALPAAAARRPPCSRDPRVSPQAGDIIQGLDKYGNSCQAQVHWTSAYWIGYLAILTGAEYGNLVRIEPERWKSTAAKCTVIRRAEEGTA